MCDCVLPASLSDRVGVFGWMANPVVVKPYIYYQGTSIRAYEDATVGPLGESRGTERPSKRRCGATVATPPKTPAGGAKRTDKGNDAVEESPEGHKAWEAGGRPKGVSNGSRTQGGSKHDAGKERTGHGGLGERTASWSKAEACAGSTEGTKPQKKWMGAEKQTSDEWQSVDTGKGLSYDKRRRGSQVPRAACRAHDLGSMKWASVGDASRIAGLRATGSFASRLPVAGLRASETLRALLVLLYAPPLPAHA